MWEQRTSLMESDKNKINFPLFFSLSSDSKGREGFGVSI